MAKTYKDKLKFNGDWTVGEAAHASHSCYTINCCCIH